MVAAAWISVDPAHWTSDLERTGLPATGTADLIELCTAKKLKYPLLAAQLARESVKPDAGGFHPFWQRVGAAGTVHCKSWLRVIVHCFVMQVHCVMLTA